MAKGEIKKVKTSDYQGYLVGQVLAGVVGALILLFADFAGYYHYDYYNKIREYGYIYLGSGFLSSALIVVAVLMLVLSVYSGIKIMRAKEVSFVTIQNHAKNSMKKGSYVAVIALVGGLVFVITNIIERTQEWWLDSGFFAALIGGALIYYFGKQISDKLKH